MPLLVVAAILGLALALPGHASAGLHNAIPADASGDPNDQFVDNDALFAYTTSDIQGGYVCILKADAPASSTCDAPAWGTKNRIIGIGTQFTLIEFDFGLVPGAWRLQTVNSDGQNGEVGGEFFVEPCNGCDNSISAQAAAQAKAAANQMGQGVAAACLGFALKDLKGAVTGARSKLKDLHERHTAYTTGDKGFLATVVPVIGGFGLSFEIPSFGNPGEEKAMEILKDLVCSATEMYASIAADPLDPGYTQIAQPTFGSLAVPLDSQATTLANLLDTGTGYGEAMLHGYERYQGAVAASAPPYVHAQARAVGQMGRSQLDQALATVAALRAEADRLDTLPEFAGPVASASTRDVISSIYARVRMSGFTFDESTQLASLGLSSAQIAAARTQFDLDPSMLPADTTLQQILRNAATTIEAQIPALEGFYRNAAVSAGRTNVAPTASFTVSPQGGPAPLQVTFTSTSTSSDLDPLTVSWNFGDGSTGQGPSVMHTYAADGTYTVTQTVSDDVASVTAQRFINVGGSLNHDPIAVNDTMMRGSHAAGVVNVLTNDSDSDSGDFLTVSSSTNGAHGMVLCSLFGTCTYTPTDGFTGPDSFTYTISDGHGGVATATVNVTINPPAAPTPVDDTLDASPTGALDVLADDADPDGDPIVLTSNSDPPHGSVTCSALGACTYTADGGYTGTDSFTYTVNDGTGRSSTATVAVTVTAQTAALDLTPEDDTAVTEAGTGVTVHVLTNDQGAPPLSVLSNTTPPHGTATCQPNGDCIYTPSAGFSGFDGFAYTVSDGNGGQRTAAVEIAVAPAALAPTLATSGRPADPAHTGDTSLPGGADAAWAAALGYTPTGLDQLAASARPLPSITSTLSGLQSIKSGSFHTAKGWTAQTLDSAHVRFNSSSDAVLGEAASDPFPAPLPPVSQGTGGDGHVPILVGTKVFAFFHHSQPTSVTCIDRRTSHLCPGYPKQLNVGAGNLIGPAAIVGTRLYVHALPEGAYAQSAPIALFCWDAATNATCGLIIVDRVERVANPGGSAPVLAGGKIYFAGDTGRLYCVDPATNAVCAGAPLSTGLSNSVGTEYDAVAHGSRVYVSTFDPKQVACIDVASGTPCAGWSTPKQFAGWNVLNQHDSDGAVVGVCVANFDLLQCVRDATPGAMTAAPGWPSTDNSYSVTLEAETGTRTLVASLNAGGLGCWDWASMGPCTGGGYNASGWIGKAVDGSDLPSAYGAAWDGSCVVGLGDPGLVFTVDPAGSSPCTSLHSGTAPRTVDLRDQRCDGTVGNATWDKVALLNTDTVGGSELKSVVVTVRDAQTGAILLKSEAIGTNGLIDLAGINPVAHPALTVDALTTSVSGNPAWADGVAPRIRVSWHADPKQACFETTTPSDCALALPATIGLASVIEATTVHRESELAVTRPASCVVSHAPVASNGTLSLDQDTSKDVTLVATDEDGDTLTYSILGGPSHGTLSGSGATRTYRPAAGYVGADSFTFKASGGSLDSNVATISIAVLHVNHAPVASDGTLALDEGTSKDAALAGSDPDGDALTYSIDSGPSHGTLSGSGATRTYTPSAGYSGPDSFTFKASDGSLSSNVATFTITVRHVSCANPLIAAVSPLQGYPGDRITVTGTGFGEAGTLLIGGTEAKVEQWSATSIVGYIPPSGGGAVVVECGSASSDRTPGAPSVRVTVKPTPNLPPDAVGYALPKKRVPGGQVFQLDGRASSDPDGRVVAWQWKLGTKLVSEKPLFSRRFPGYARAYVLKLTVRDNKGATATTVAKLRTAKKTPPRVEQPTEIKIVAPSDLLFGFDSCVVSGAGRSYLTKLRPLVVKSVFVSLAGHTDWAGDDAYNLELGRCRAQAVEKVLFAGVSRKGKKISVVSFGKRKPLASNTTPTGRAKNRRVEITLRVKS